MRVDHRGPGRVLLLEADDLVGIGEELGETEVRVAGRGVGGLVVEAGRREAIAHGGDLPPAEVDPLRDVGGEVVDLRRQHLEVEVAARLEDRKLTQLLVTPLRRNEGGDRVGRAGRDSVGDRQRPGLEVLANDRRGVTGRVVEPQLADDARHRQPRPGQVDDTDRGRRLRIGRRLHRRRRQARADRAELGRRATVRGVGVGDGPHDAVVRTHHGQRPPGDRRVGLDLEHDVLLAFGGEGGLHLHQRARQRQRIPRWNDPVAEVEPLPRLGQRQFRPEQRRGHGDERQHPAGGDEPSAPRRRGRSDHRPSVVRAPDRRCGRSTAATARSPGRPPRSRRRRATTRHGPRR